MPGRNIAAGATSSDPQVAPGADSRVREPQPAGAAQPETDDSECRSRCGPEAGETATAWYGPMGFQLGAPIGTPVWTAAGRTRLPPQEGPQ